MCTDPVYGVTFSHPRVFILISHKDQGGDTASVHAAYFNTSFQAYTRTFENQPSGCTAKRMTDDIAPVALASDIAAQDAATSVVSYPGVDPSHAAPPRTACLLVTVQNVSAHPDTWQGLPSSASGLISGQVWYDLADANWPKYEP